MGEDARKGYAEVYVADELFLMSDEKKREYYKEYVEEKLKDKIVAKIFEPLDEGKEIILSSGVTTEEKNEQTNSRVFRRFFRCETVVRCKNCKWNGSKNETPYCTKLLMDRDQNWYCAAGEEKAENKK